MTVAPSLSCLPGKIVQCKTADLAEALKDEGKRCFITGPKNVHGIYGDIINAALGKRAKIYAGFNGECCEAEIDRLAAGVKTHKSDFIFSFGGGKAMDTSKSVAAKTGRRLIVLPTSASTCAAFTSHSVIYGEKGNFLRADKHFKCPDTLILAEEILESAPKRLLFSGIADACAKYYEFTFNGGVVKENSMAVVAEDMLKRFFMSVPAVKKSPESKMILSLSRLCIINTGLISALGGASFKATTAHALANGFTQIFPERPQFARLLHGELVGAGILACLFSLNRIDELIMLRKLFSDCGIFEEFAACGKLALEDFETVSSFAVKSERQFRKLKLKVSDLTSALGSLKIDNGAVGDLPPQM